jgi:hypothetical protein
MPELEMLSVVALLDDLAAEGLYRGQVGTVVEMLSSGVYEVEFSDDSGRTSASNRRPRRPSPAPFARREAPSCLIFGRRIVSVCGAGWPEADSSLSDPHCIFAEQKGC